eukprot:2313572-Pleurochrysis_carterae.AAC.1
MHASVNQVTQSKNVHNRKPPFTGGTEYCSSRIEITALCLFCDKLRTSPEKEFIKAMIKKTRPDYRDHRIMHDGMRIVI